MAPKEIPYTLLRTEHIAGSQWVLKLVGVAIFVESDQPIVVKKQNTWAGENDPGFKSPFEWSEDGSVW